MRELLERWAALQPEWCAVDDERASVMTDVGTPLERPRFTAQFHRLGQYEPLILAAVIEAVEASGRIFALDGGLDMPDRYVANVTRKGCGWLDGTNAGAETPAAALLGAYLAALEAEADQ